MDDVATSHHRATMLVALVSVVTALSTCGRDAARACVEKAGARVCIVRHGVNDELAATGLEPGSPGTLTQMPEQVLVRAVARSDGTITVTPLAPPSPSTSMRFEGVSNTGHQVAMDLRWPAR